MKKVFVKGFAMLAAVALFVACESKEAAVEAPVETEMETAEVEEITPMEEAPVEGEEAVVTEEEAPVEGEEAAATEEAAQ